MISKGQGLLKDPCDLSMRVREMELHELDYHLPQDRIAQFPSRRRDHARLLVLQKSSGEISHGRIKDIVKWLRKGDLLVFNDTRVIPARLYGIRKDTCGRVEILLCQPLSQDGSRVPPTVEAGAFNYTRWQCLVRARGKIEEKVAVDLGDGVEGVVERKADEWILELNGVRNVLSFLKRRGLVPLPPYVARPPQVWDKRRYQTVLARRDGSIAAPTAGLHFTRGLLKRLEEAGVRIGKITLQVGLGTFRAVRTPRVEDHEVDPEYVEVGQECCELWAKTKEEGGRVVAVGTTVVRALETAAAADRGLKPYGGFTSLSIYPGYTFKAIDALVTNFHLPRTSLLALVMAFAGKEKVRMAYEDAIRRGYRFYSYGDAMLIL